MSVSVLFVCLGNICRSPTAHGVFRAKVQQAGLSSRIQVDSCGTAAWHIGKQPDLRSQAAAKQRGYDLSDLRARQLVSQDFDRYDYVLVMDKENFRNAKQLAPEGYQGTLALFLDFAYCEQQEVPDPYYGGDEGFQHVLDLVEAASDGLIKHIVDNDFN